MARFWIAVVLFCVASQRYQGNDCNQNTRQTRYFPTPSYATVKLSQNGKKLFGTTCTGRIPTTSDRNCYIEVLDAVSGATLSRILFNSTIINMVVAPNGERFFIGDVRGGWIVETNDGLWTPVPIWIVHVAWSPDSLLLIGTDDKSVNLLLLNSSGALLKNWTTELVYGICWAPGNLISISSTSQGGMMTRYHSNGILTSSVAQLGVWGYSLVCSPDSTVALTWSLGIALVDLAGNVTKKSVGGPTSPLTWDAQGKLLISCSLAQDVRPCEVYNVFLQRLLEITETTQHNGLGLSPDETTMTLVTITAGGAFFWNIQPPHIRTFDPRSAQHTPSLGWIDRDRFVVGEDFQLREFNVRTGTFDDFTYDTQNAMILSCIMSGELYLLLDNGTITVFAQGKQLRYWDTGVTSDKERHMSCSYNDQIAITHWRSVLVWNHLGQFVENKTVSFNIQGSAFYNTSRFALWNQTTRWMWNAQTGQLDTIFSSSSPGALAKWSPDGSWLVIQEVLWPSSIYTWKIHQYDGTYVMQIDSTVERLSMGQQADWSSDSNWLILQGPPSLLVSPKLKESYPAGGTPWDEAWWNPQTMEVLSLTRWRGEGGTMYITCNLWVPTPTVRQLIGGKRVDVLAPTTVSLVGGNLLPSSTKAMLRWVDTSTAIPQCMFLTATQVDAFTFSLGNVTLPDPALYIVYLEYATDNPTSPWLGAEVSFTASCGEHSLPILSLTGGVTTCTCMYDRYGVPSTTNSGLQCLPCPPHGRCNGSSLVRSEESYWPKTEDPFYFMPCAPGACPGGNVCSDLYEGPVCGLCKPGSGQYGFGRCRRCNSIWVDVLLIILGLVCWIAFCTLQALFALGWRNNKSRGNNSTQLVAVIVSTTQVHALLLSVDVKLDSVPNALGFTQDAVQGGGIQSAVLSCLLINSGWSPSSVHYVKQVLMLLLPLVGWVILLAVRAFLRFRNIDTSVDVVRVPTVVLWVSLQSAMTTSLLQTLQCTPINSQGFKFRLSHDLSVACYDTTYYSFVGIVTIPAIILTTIVIPVSIIWLLQFHPLDSRSSHLKFLVKNYRTHWWYLVIFYRKVLLSALVTFTENPLYVAAALLGLAIVNVIVWPSAALVVNVAETVSLTTAAFVFAAAGALGSQERVYKYCAVVLISVSLFSYVIQSALLLHDRLQGAKNKDQQDILLEPIQPDNDEHYARLLS